MDEDESCYDIIVEGKYKIMDTVKYTRMDAVFVIILGPRILGSVFSASWKLPKESKGK